RVVHVQGVVRHLVGVAVHAHAHVARLDHLVDAEIKKSGGTAVGDDPAKVLGDLQKKAEQIAANQ
ncbi:hypothetical protein AB0D90_13465, partial [Streptomyces althioticus]|uniref:hypothetical protein n=1 Tax=Streptomyces althioticus TaxID=83380 RepID=UPI0033DFB5A9